MTINRTKVAIFGWFQVLLVAKNLEGKGGRDSGANMLAAGWDVGFGHLEAGEKGKDIKFRAPFEPATALEDGGSQMLGTDSLELNVH